MDQGWTIAVPDQVGQKGRNSLREQLDKIWEEFGTVQPVALPPQVQPQPVRRRHGDGWEEPMPRWQATQSRTRGSEAQEERPQRDTRRVAEQTQEVGERSALEAMEERLAKAMEERLAKAMEERLARAMEERLERALRSVEDTQRRPEVREGREMTVTNPRTAPESMPSHGLAVYTGEGEPSNLTVFTNFTKNNPVLFKGQLPTPFAYGRESLKEFKIRYTAFAVASGWSGPNQVSIMLRCLEQGPLNTFLDWIEKGFLRGMDVDRMWRLMEEKFCDPGSERRTAKTELAHRTQERGESTLAYEQVFLKLAAKAGLSEEEKVEKWLENIHPSISKAIRLLGAEGGELTFERAAKIARRVDLAEEDRPPPLQTAVRRSVHAVTTAQEDSATSVNAVKQDAVLAAQEAQTRTIQAIREAISVDMKRELASQTRQMEEGLKRKLDTMQAFRVPHVPTAPASQAPRREERRGAPYRTQGQFQAKKRPYSNLPKLPEDLCHRCGDASHKVGDCTWMGGACEYCGRMNHRAAVCYTRLRAEENKGAK